MGKISAELRDLVHEVSAVLLAPSPKRTDADRAARKSANIVLRVLRGAAGTAWRARQAVGLGLLAAYGHWLLPLVVGAAYGLMISVLTARTGMRIVEHVVLSTLVMLCRLLRKMLQLPANVPAFALSGAIRTVELVASVVLRRGHLSAEQRAIALRRVRADLPAVVGALQHPPPAEDLVSGALAARSVIAHLPRSVAATPRRTSPRKSKNGYT